jgi:hypothetical protein
MTPLTLRSIFARLDTSKNEQVTRDEARAFVDAAGVARGENPVARALKLQLATNELMDRFGGADGSVTFADFTRGFQRQMTALGCSGSAEGCDVSRALLAYFDDADVDGDLALTAQEMLPGIREALRRQGVANPDLVAPEVVKVTLRMVDEDLGGTFDVLEAKALASELAALS